MATTVSTYRLRNVARVARLAFWTVLLGWFQRWNTTHAKHRRLSRDLHGIEPRLLLDMGVDPADLYGEFWSYDEIQRREAGRLNKVRPLPWR